MSRKTYDLAVKVGSYTDREGNEKGRYENIGAVMDGDKGPFIMLKKTFNPAGVNTDRDSILVSMFEPKDREPRRAEYDEPGEPRGQRIPASRDIDDEIPF
jgi:hypothetical protein